MRNASIYPFSAIIGCAPNAPDGLDDMGLALILTAIAPEIGGVLIRGEKGTAKSTAVRALAPILPSISVFPQDRFSIDPSDPNETSPDGSFTADPVLRPVRLVELPVGATEDRVLGSLHLERALTQGKVEYEPGLLARAHRGILYVDEVNLLHDHLVDLLLDAAAMGRVSVERDGVSVEHAARFVLIGTMNPEEGELRPQLLDRFGLTVEISAPQDPNTRAEVVRRRIAFDTDHSVFAAPYAETDHMLTERIAAARARLTAVALGDAALLTIARVCTAFHVDGLRADIVTARAAVAHAAWLGRDQVTKADIRQAALLSLPHRRRRNPFDAPGLDETLLDQILSEEDLPEPPDPEPTPPRPQNSQNDTDISDDGTQPDTDLTDLSSPPPPIEPPVEPPVETSSTDGPTAHHPIVTAGTTYRPKLLTVRGLGTGVAGRRSRAFSNTGRRVGAKPGHTGSVHLVETIKAAAGSTHNDGLRIAPDHLRVAIREGREANLVLFCVDASGSMAARKRMTEVKTAILSLLLDAYRRRDKVGLITFRGNAAVVVLPPTSSVDIAATRLDELPAGGRTPLAEGLLEAARVLERERLRNPRLRPLLVVVTDARATAGPDAVLRSQMAADYVARLGVTTVVIDSESGVLRLGLARELAMRLNGEHIPVSEVNAAALAQTVTRYLQPIEGVA